MPAVATAHGPRPATSSPNVLVSPAIRPPVLQLILLPQRVLEQVRDDRREIVAIVERRMSADALMYVILMGERDELDAEFTRLVAVAVQDWQDNYDPKPNVRLAWAVAHEGSAFVARPTEFSGERLDELEAALSKPRDVPTGPHALAGLHWRIPMGLAAAMLAAVREESERRPSTSDRVAGKQRTISMQGLLAYI